jgi:subtilisin family serine protease
MPELPHLILPRAQVDMDRRKRPGYGSQPTRDYKVQSLKVSRAVDEALATHRNLAATIVDPALIVRVRTANVLPEEQWIRAGLTVLGQDEKNSVILFASDADLTEFRLRLEAYSQGIPAGQKSPQYASLIAAIEELGPLSPSDRIGNVLKGDGFETPENFSLNATFKLDVELWEIGTQDERLTQVDLLEIRLSELGGEITDRYVGVSFTALRVSGTGATFRWLLNLPTVRIIDRPPVIDEHMEALLDTTISEIGEPAMPSEDAPSIAVLDSGINDAHPVLTNVVQERAGFPSSIGISDSFGHGTKVSGVATYGDVRDCIETQNFSPRVRLLAGKVVNDQGNFDDNMLVPSQMDAAIRYFHEKGCRIFNLSLGDINAVYSGGKVGTWTATLDDLARELNVLIVVSAGNYTHIPAQGHAEEVLTDYPSYLLDSPSRLLEPSVGANVLTVGAVAQAAAVPNDLPGTVGVRPIASVGEPAPFTRSGPGIQKAIKPDLCDDGGNVLFDGTTQTLKRFAESEIMTAHSRYLERLFTTARGTSYAAPLVAHKAALVLQAFPEASANLLRALLANSARVPPAAIAKLQSQGKEAIRNLCGYGISNVELASTSDANRVVLYADDSIAMDHFYVYEVPIPTEFTETKGARSIRVTLAFDPPTRHTRNDYLGVEMSFRLVRGKTLEQVIDHFKKRTKEEGKPPALEGKFDCGFDIGPTIRERGTLQCDTFTMSQNPSQEYNDTYYLVVRCENQWNPDEFLRQRFAVVLELFHPEIVNLYQRVSERIRVRQRV